MVYDALMEAGADLGVRPVGLAAMAGLRLEKGYRDLGVDIDNTDNPLAGRARLRRRLRQARRLHRPGRPGDAAGHRAPIRRCWSSLLVEDPDVRLFGNEPVLRRRRLDRLRPGRRPTGTRWAAASGLAMVEREEGVTPEWLASGSFAVRTPSGTYPVTVSRKPLYDPARRRILAED